MSYRYRLAVSQLSVKFVKTVEKVRQALESEIFVRFFCNSDSVCVVGAVAIKGSCSQNGFGQNLISMQLLDTGRRRL